MTLPAASLPVSRGLPVSPGLTAPLTLTGGGVDRGGADRRKQGWLDAALAAPQTRVLPVAAGRTLIAGSALAAPAASECVELLAQATVTVWLGRLHGVDWVAAAVSEEALQDQVARAAGPGDVAGGRDDAVQLAGLRDVGERLSAGEAALFTQAVAVLNWHAVTGFCSRCGAPTQAVEAGWVRRCTKEGTEHFPRTDPAVIVVITDEQDRVLLGANAAWGGSRYSLFAGFVEPGESLEEAVIREVEEEAGVRLEAPRYVASQPWPFPASLMLGFTARATQTASIPDGEEIVATRWFTREELRTEVEAGRIGIPGGISVAGALLAQWYGAELPQAKEAWPVDPNGADGLTQAAVTLPAGANTATDPGASPDAGAGTNAGTDGKTQENEQENTGA